MNKTFWIGFVVIYVVFQAIGYVLHQVLLADTYAALAAVFRPQAEMTSMMWVFFISSAVALFLFCYIFTYGREGKGIIEGVRYGGLMGVFYSVPGAIDPYVVYPLTGNLALIWLVSTIVIFMIGGAIFAAIYKP